MFKAVALILSLWGLTFPQDTFRANFLGIKVPDIGVKFILLIHEKLKVQGNSQFSIAYVRAKTEPGPGLTIFGHCTKRETGAEL